jgi:hypothetical protein
MATDKLNNALEKVGMCYGDLVKIANDMLNDVVSPAKTLIREQLDKNINSLSIDALRDYMWQLQVQSFNLSEIKEKAVFKADLADALQKEAYAIKFNEIEGSAAVKEKQAVVAVSEEILTEILYSLCANLLKTTLDEIHRAIDALKSILMSRMQESKFMQVGQTSEIPGTTNGRIILNE